MPHHPYRQMHRSANCHPIDMNVRQSMIAVATFAEVDVQLLVDAEVGAIPVGEAAERAGEVMIRTGRSKEEFRQAIVRRWLESRLIESGLHGRQIHRSLSA